jgi:two-component sensor histidine kinase
VHRVPGRRDPLWPALLLPALVLVALAALTLYAAAYLRREGRDEAIESSQIVRTLLARSIERTWDDLVKPLRRLQIQWSSKGLPAPAAFNESIADLVNQLPAYRMVSVVGANNKVVASWGRQEADRLAVGQDLTTDPVWGDAMRQIDPEAVVASARAGLVPTDCVPIVIPLLHQEETQPVASIIALVCVSELLRDVLDPRLEKQFNVALRDENDAPRFTEGAAPAAWASPMAEDEPVRVLDTRWDLRVLPADSWSQGMAVGEPLWSLIVGGVVSILASGTMLQAMLYRRRERQRTRQQLDALESLNEVSAALTANPSAGLEILRQLADDARRMLRMPMVSVLLLDSGGKRVRLVHSAGIQTPFKQEYELDEVPGTVRCFETGEVLFAPDVQHDPGPFNIEKIKSYDVRAVILLPMIVNGKPLGVIGLSDHVVRDFSDVEVRMARLWAAQAAVILAQARLYDQLKQHSETNETLLRELNHRVKNNLAGILGLLEIGRPRLSEEARRWLERVAARVQTMAQTHELFTGGMRAVGIEDLVNKTLAPIRAMKPPQVRIDVEMSRLPGPVPVERAVTLAIVLNELCYNSLVHGITGGGTLLVRGRTSGAGLATVDVIDRPSNSDAYRESSGAVAVASSTGIGLALVRALVGRELRGRLSVDPIPGGGTVASVEFPLDAHYVQGDDE